MFLGFLFDSREDRAGTFPITSPYPDLDGVRPLVSTGVGSRGLVKVPRG